LSALPPLAPLTLGALLGDAQLPAALAVAPVAGVSSDSRQVTAGDLFLALADDAAQRASHLQQAALRGAVAALVPAACATPAPLPTWVVADLRQEAVALAARCYGDPAASLRLVGITGTNGKTSIAHFIATILNDLRPTAVIGTLGFGRPGAWQPHGMTTPDGVTLQRQFAALRASGVSDVVMEVSSHALDQRRVDELYFPLVIFSNLSHDHLDYHGSFARYAAAKRRLLELRGEKTAIINRDDAIGREWLATLPRGVSAISYSLEDRGADYSLTAIEQSHDGVTAHLVTPIGQTTLQAPLLGRFNLSNLLAAIAALVVLGVPLATIVARMATLAPPPGRLDRLGGVDQPLVVVDYAHTPDALRQVLLALRPHCRGTLWSLFGCGGNRDAAKRPLMGAVAAQLADRVVVTDDNPRHEDPAEIVAAILRGIPPEVAVEVEHDRARAIAAVIAQADRDDVILIAGKGHETTQIVGDRVLPFDDRQVALHCLSGGGV
jgi:UDP-N-acetylmuramoyl-L-alanyl-D-glutamate--2,6-diaminopimelate ligase